MGDFSLTDYVNFYTMSVGKAKKKNTYSIQTVIHTRYKGFMVFSQLMISVKL